jgi:xylose isomerase
MVTGHHGRPARLTCHEHIGDWYRRRSRQEDDVAGFFPDVPERIAYGGLGSTDPFAFKVYEPDRVVLGRRMEEHLRIAVCLWHSFNWPGSDVFGAGTFDRPWLSGTGEPMEAARQKVDAAFEFLDVLGVPFFTFHDRDVAPEGGSFSETRANLDAVSAAIEKHMERTGVRLLWGTANLFSHPRYAAGAATNPDPEVFAYAAAQVKVMLETTHRLDGENYVLWGGREGYETLLNTDLRREEQQLARFLTLVAEHKHRIGFDGMLLLEPKPQEPTKHQYDYDVATVDAFLTRHGLADEYRVNIEVNHATLAGHSFHHEVAVALSRGIFGSIDINRGDYQNGWDTDQFPNSVDELAMAMVEILRAGGFSSGGFNFDAKLRRQSIDRNDLFHAHIGGIDTLARALLVGAAVVEAGTLDRLREERYAGWNDGLGASIIDGGLALPDIEARVVSDGIEPRPVSGGQERLENLVNQAIWSAERDG